MQNKKKHKQTFKIIIILLIIIMIAVGITIAIINNKDNNSTNAEDNTLIGTFIYNENVKYEFNNNGKGAMYDNETEYKYSYTINENKLVLDFENEAVHDATYRFKLENSTLTLNGEEGTMGGKYILEKESK